MSRAVAVGDRARILAQRGEQAKIRELRGKIEWDGDLDAWRRDDDQRRQRPDSSIWIDIFRNVDSVAVELSSQASSQLRFPMNHPALADSCLLRHAIREHDLGQK